MRVELFHALSDAGSAACRRAIVERKLADRVTLRNVYFASHAAALAALGGARVPALWDGAALAEGKDAVLAALARL